MTEHVARSLCRAACIGDHCPWCDPTETEPVKRPCQQWQLFLKEAIAAIAAVRDYARLDMRRKPRPPGRIGDRDERVATN